VRGQRGGEGQRGGRGQLLAVGDALPCPAVTDRVVFLFLFSFICLFYASFSMEERGSPVTVSLISNHEQP